MLAVLRNRVLLIFILLMLSGCSLHYADKNGSNHYLGFVSLRTEQYGCLITNSVKSFGLTVDMTKDSGGLNIGFRTVSKSYIQDDIEITLDETVEGVMKIKEYDNSMQWKKKNCTAE